MKQRLLAFLVMSVLAVSSVFAQNRTIKGKVTGADDGLGLPGVSVRVKGTSIGASTGIDGDYSISVPADAKTLTFTYVGYLTQEIAIGANGTVNVTLATDAKQLSEVVVTGYGTQIKKEFTGATAKVDDSQLKDRPMPSVDALLQGQVAGLQVAGSSGQPGANAAVRIRGIGSITAGSSPLYVVDGVIMNNGDFSRITTTSSQLAGINPNDIESVSVLKDAAATSIYGSRGANGVIIINTKRGVAGKTKFAFSSEVGTTDIAARPD
ncbi:MAG TPA: TonB-dependent receptor plug domain-containing protein, partial [Sphingobacteriaceae bacterium]